MIDICDFAVGLSRQLYGRSIASERPGHRLTETWHPLGPIAVISAFNFPVAVWSWNAALALVCGDPVIWKPSERTPLTALATHVAARPRGRALRRRARRPLRARHRRRRPGRPARRRRADPARLGHRLDRDGQGARAAHRRPPRPLAARAGRQQRRDRRAERRPRPRRAWRPVLRRRHRRPALHEPPPPDRPRVDRGRPRRASRDAYRSVPIGDPREPGTLVGPLVTGEAFGRMEAALGEAVAPTAARSSSAAGGRSADAGPTRGTRSRRSSACRHRPTSSGRRRSRRSSTCSATTTSTRRSRSRTASRRGSRRRSSRPTCARRSASSPRPAPTAGSRTSTSARAAPRSAARSAARRRPAAAASPGSDAWKAYMRRQTATVNFTSELPLAQGIVFDVD